MQAAKGVAISLVNVSFTEKRRRGEEKIKNGSVHRIHMRMEKENLPAVFGDHIAIPLLHSEIHLKTHTQVLEKKEDIDNSVPRACVSCVPHASC